VLVDVLTGLPDGEVVLWMDPDAVVVPDHLDEKLDSVLLPDSDIGLVEIGRPFSRYNAGVMFIRRSLEMVKFFSDVLALGVVPGAPIISHEQARINDLLPKTSLKVQTLDKRYNGYAPLDPVDPVVFAFHSAQPPELIPVLLHMLINGQKFWKMRQPNLAPRAVPLKPASLPTGLIGSLGINA
jgi:hypothetical protein